jgi:hypothetical protein
MPRNLNDIVRSRIWLPDEFWTILIKIHYVFQSLYKGFALIKNILIYKTYAVKA